MKDILTDIVKLGLDARDLGDTFEDKNTEAWEQLHEFSSNSLDVALKTVGIPFNSPEYCRDGWYDLYSETKNTPEGIDSFVDVILKESGVDWEINGTVVNKR